MNDELIDAVRSTRLALESTRGSVESAGPWPLATVFDHSDEAQWGPPEVLAHVAEMVPFWLGEMERVLAGAPEPVPFGRIATDPVRIAILGRDRTVPPAALYDRISNDLRLLERRLAELTPAELARRGLHPTRGEMTVASMPDVFITGHLTEHVGQLATLLADRPTPG
jgi:DinB superfamily